MANATRSTSNFMGDRLDVKMFGVVGDGVILEDGAITAADSTLTSVSGAFVAGDIGKTIWVEGAGTAGADLLTTIASINSGTSVELTAAAGTTVSGATTRYGTDDAAAFSEISTWVTNHVNRVNIYFPPGIYLYSSGLAFVKPVALFSDAGATLVYTGTGKALSMGPSGLTINTCRPHFHYSVRGLRFMGGELMSHGLYFDSFITQPRISDVTFEDFGNISAWCVFFQSDNWDINIQNCRYYSKGTITRGRNWICVNGYSAGAVWDNGNSRLRITDCLASHQDDGGGGCGIYVNGWNPLIKGNKIEGFSPCIRVGSDARYGKIIHNYFETPFGNDSIEYGDATGAHTDHWIQDLTVRDNYCNLHNTDYSTTSHLLGPSTANTGLQYSIVEGNHITNCDASRPLVKLNNTAGQLGNRGGHNTKNGAAVDILHTAGANIDSWVDLDGDEFLVNNPNDDTAVLVLKAGATAEQYRVIAFRSGVDNLDKASVECGSDGRLYLKANSHIHIQCNTDGSLTLPNSLWIGDDGQVSIPAALWLPTLSASLPLKTTAGQSVTAAQIILTTEVTGTLPVANGGTGAVTLADHGVLLGSDTGAVTVTAAGTAGQPLISNGAAADPSFQNIATSGFGSQTAKYFLAAPNGADGNPSFRAIVASDVPTLNQNTTGTAGALSNTLSVSLGGTGATTLTSHGVVIGNSGSAVNITAAGSTGYVLTGNGASADPTFQTPAAKFVDRGDAAASDISHTGLTIDNAWHDLDLTTYGVPDDAIGVAMRVSGSNTNANVTMLLRKNGNSNEVNCGSLTTQVANVTVSTDMIVPLGSGAVIEYLVYNTGTWSLYFCVKGWWK